MQEKKPLTLAELVDVFVAMPSAEAEQAVIEKCKELSPIPIASQFKNLSSESPARKLLKHVLNEKLSVLIDKAQQKSDVAGIDAAVIAMGESNLTEENQKKYAGLNEKLKTLLKEKIEKIELLQNLKEVTAEKASYESKYGQDSELNALFATKKKEVFQKQVELLNNPVISLDEKLLCYKRSIDLGVFDDAEKSELKSIFNQQTNLNINEINKDTLPKDILLIKLCVKALNDPHTSARYQSKQATLKGSINEASSIAHLDTINNDKALTTVEKTQKIDGVMSVYFSLYGQIPLALEAKYAELSKHYKNQMVGELREYGTGLFANLDVDSMQRQALTKDKSQKKPAGETDAARPLSKGFNSISAGVVRSVLENGDFNAGILSTKRWIETAATMYEKGDFYSAHAIMTGLSNFPKYMDVIKREGGLHAGLKSSLDDLLSAGKAYKNIRAGERLELARGNDQFLPSISYKFSDMTFFYDGNPPKEVLDGAGKGTGVFIDRRPLLLEPYYAEFRSKKAALGQAPQKDLAQTFGTAEPLDEKTMHLYSATVFEIEGSEPLIPLTLPTIDDVQGDLTLKQEAVTRSATPAKGVVTDELAQTYNEHLKNNDGISKDFYTSPEYKQHVDKYGEEPAPALVDVPVETPKSPELKRVPTFMQNLTNLAKSRSGVITRSKQTDEEKSSSPPKLGKSISSFITRKKKDAADKENELDKLVKSDGAGKLHAQQEMLPVETERSPRKVEIFHLLSGVQYQPFIERVQKLFIHEEIPSKFDQEALQEFVHQIGDSIVQGKNGEPVSKLSYEQYRDRVSQIFKQHYPSELLLSISKAEYEEIFPRAQRDSIKAEKEDYLYAISQLNNPAMQALLIAKLKDKDLSQYTLGRVDGFLQKLKKALEKESGLSYSAYVDLLGEFKIAKIFNMGPQEFGFKEEQFSAVGGVRDAVNMAAVLPPASQASISTPTPATPVLPKYKPANPFLVGVGQVLNQIYLGLSNAVSYVRSFNPFGASTKAAASPSVSEAEPKPKAEKIIIAEDESESEEAMPKHLDVLDTLYGLLDDINDEAIQDDMVEKADALPRRALLTPGIEEDVQLLVSALNLGKPPVSEIAFKNEEMKQWFGLLSTNDEKLKGINNETLRKAMLNVLDKKGFSITGDVTDAVQEINTITQHLVSPLEYTKLYNRFLDVAKSIPGVNAIKPEFIVAMVVMGNKFPSQDFSKKMKNLSYHEINELSTLASKIETELANIAEYIKHLKEALSSKYFDAATPEHQKLEEEVDRMNVLSSQLDHDLGKINAVRHEKRTSVEKTVRREVSAVDGLIISRNDAPADVKSEPIEKVVLYKNKAFKEIAKPKETDLLDHHFTVRERSVSYTPPANKDPLKAEELNKFIDQMLKAALAICKTPDERENLVLAGSTELVKLAKTRLPAVIEQLKPTVESVAPERSRSEIRERDDRGKKERH